MNVLPSRSAWMTIAWSVAVVAAMYRFPQTRNLLTGMNG